MSRTRARARAPRWRHLAGPVMAGALVAGCSGLPDHSPVQTGRSIEAQVDGGVRVALYGPVPGEGPREIVLGFLRASIGFDDDPTVGRQFLTRDAAPQWVSRGVTIYEDAEPPTVSLIGDTVTVVAQVTGALDADGHYRDLPPGTTTRLVLPMRKERGEWRIADGLKGFGALMSRGDFLRYRSFPIPYVLPGNASVVDDQRWLLTGPGIETRIARAVIAPAPAYLQGAVLTGAPDYSELVGAVSVAGGTATVTVSNRATEADASARRALWTRMVLALTRVRGIDRVDLVAGDARLPVDGLPGRALAAGDVSLPAPRLRTDVALTRVGEQLTPVLPTTVGPDDDPRRAARVPGVPALPRLPLSWYHVAWAADLAEIAAVGGDDAELNRWRGGKQVRISRFATDLTRPAYDSSGIVWVGGRTREGARIFVLDTVGAGTRPAVPTALNVPWLAGRRIVALEVAEDGARIAVVSAAEDGTGARLDVAGIVRRGRQPVSLAAPRPVASALVDITDTTWVDPTTLAVIGRRPSDRASQAVVAPLNDKLQVLGAVPDARTITAAGSERSLVIVTAGYRVLIRSGINRFTPLTQSREFALPGR